MLALLMAGIHDVYVDDMVYIPSFIKIDVGVQAILRFSLRNLSGCDAGITDERDL
jgi:hypothetical protein